MVSRGPCQEKVHGHERAEQRLVELVPDNLIEMARAWPNTLAKRPSLTILATASSAWSSSEPTDRELRRISASHTVLHGGMSHAVHGLALESRPGRAGGHP